MQDHEFANELQAVYRRLWLVAAGLVGDPSDAEDIVQDTAIIAFRKRGEFRRGTNFAAWVTTILRHCAANHLRKKTGRRTYPADPHEFDQQTAADGRSVGAGELVNTRSDTREVSALQEEFDDDLLHVLNGLAPDARCCLLLRVVDSTSYTEIAQSLGIPEGTAVSHVSRSKHVLRSFFEQQLRAPTDE